jgi:hypothetical protein
VLTIQFVWTIFVFNHNALGIGKDEGVSVFKENGFENVIVEAGGDLIGMGKKTSRSPWKIGLQAPRSEIGSLMQRSKSGFGYLR